MGVPIYCETDPVSSRWTGVGRLLTAFEVDQNFYYHEARIETLEGEIRTNVGVSYISLHGDQLEFHMTDHSIQGPFNIPLAIFRNRGTWAPSTPYSVYDIFTINGSLYLVDISHTSALTFNPNATDGFGHDLYVLLLNVPGSALPAGGATAQVLQKSSSADYAVTWGYKLPTGGTTGQILTKNSNTNQDASWLTSSGLEAPPPSPAGVAGDSVATVDGTPTNMEWIKVTYAPSSNGTTGQFLATVSGLASHTEWVTGVYAPPASPAGTAGQFLATVDGTPINMEWSSVSLSTISGFSITSPTDGDQLRYNTAGTDWVNRQLASVAAGNITSNYPINPDSHPLITATPTGNVQIDNGGRNGKVGQIFVLEITTSGTSSWNVTFSSGDWVTQGTLATGTVSGKKFTLSFMCDSNGILHEMSRIGPF